MSTKTPRTRLVWNQQRVAAVLGFSLGVLTAVLLSMAIDSVPEPAPPCEYHAPMLPVTDCEFVMNGNG